MDDINWNLCCLCQIDTNERLQNPTLDGYLSLEKQLKEFKNLNATPSEILVPTDKLDDGSGIADTLKSHNAKYHKSCRLNCSASRLKRKQDKQQGQPEPNPQPSPKKLRSAKPSSTEILSCVICNGNQSEDLHKVETEPVDANLRQWAQSTKNFLLLGKLITTAADAHAGDIYYHGYCYTKLRYEDQAARKPPPQIKMPSFDPIVIAQIVTNIETSNVLVYKLSNLRSLYRKLMEEQGHPCPNSRDPHATRFKQHKTKCLYHIFVAK